MQKSKAHQLASQHTVIIGLGKASHHMLAGKKEGEPHVLSERGSEVMKHVAERYHQHSRLGNEVHVIFAGGRPNYNTPQKFIPFLRGHVPEAPQAELLKEAAIAQGVMGNHITAVPKGSDMMQNLVAVKNHLAELEVKPKLEIFVDGHQLKRAEMVAKHVLNGYEIEVKPVFVERGLGMKIFETFVYEPAERVYMWAGVRVHRVMYNAKYKA